MKANKLRKLPPGATSSTINVPGNGNGFAIYIEADGLPPVHRMLSVISKIIVWDCTVDMRKRNLPDPLMAVYLKDGEVINAFMRED